MENKNYLFPDFLAKAMSKVDMRTQYESSMMSMSFMCLGMIVTIVYLVIYFDFAWWYKIFLVVNGLAGMVFMWSYLVTTYQQYLTYLNAMEFQKECLKTNERGLECVNEEN